MARLPREAAVLIALVLLLGAVFILSLVVGSTKVPPSRVIDVLLRSAGERDADAVVIETIRLPRSLTALLAGVAVLAATA